MQPRCLAGDETEQHTWFRVDVDLDGDGTAEVLLSRSDSPSGNAGRWFEVYRHDGKGTVAHLGSVFAHPLAMSRQALELDSPSGLLAYLRSNSSSGALVRYTVDEASLKSVKLREIYPRTTDRELYDRLFGSEQRLHVLQSSCDGAALRWTR